MDVSGYYRSLTLELSALKDRVRYLIGIGHHNPTDGEWKETVLRTILRRHLPSTIKVGRGFVITPNGPSKQIDLLIYDASKPVLYQDGDLVMITSDSVKGIIEVKTKIESISKLKKGIEQVVENAKFIHTESSLDNERDPIFIGLFSYESGLNERHSLEALEALRDIAGGRRERVVNHLCLGDSFFFRFWDTSPNWELNYNKWHSYWLESKAPGYFVNNAVDAVARDSVKLNQDLWFPITGKEGNNLDCIDFSVDN